LVGELAQPVGVVPNVRIDSLVQAIGDGSQAGWLEVAACSTNQIASPINTPFRNVSSCRTTAIALPTSGTTTKLIAAGRNCESWA
jgi:hypothetical protein